MLYGEYDPEVEKRVIREEERDYFLELLDQDLTKEEIKERIQQEKKILNETLF
ncbi:hypothetical protein R84B8_01304 [Treponema sp. R8-4-B8]